MPTITDASAAPEFLSSLRGITIIVAWDLCLYHIENPHLISLAHRIFTFSLNWLIWWMHQSPFSYWLLFSPVFIQVYWTVVSVLFTAWETTKHFCPLQNPLHFTTARILSPFAPFTCDWFCSFFYQFFLEWSPDVFHSFITSKYYYTATERCVQYCCAATST